MTTKPNEWEQDFRHKWEGANGTLCSVTIDSMIEDISVYISQAILSAEAKGREQILELADGITFEDGFGGRVDVRKELLDFEKFMKALSLPDQEQLEIKGRL